MSKRTMQEILTAAGYTPRAYSGRGVGGKTCLAVDGDSLGSLFANVLEALDSEENEIAAHAFVRRCRQLDYPTTIGAVRVKRGQRT